MSKDINTRPRYGKDTALFCMAVLALNLLGVLITQLTGVPLYLDTAGSIIAGAVGGYLPGVVVGFLTNMIKGLISSQALYYGVLNMLTALTAAFMANRGFFRSFPKALIAVPVMTIITGIPGTFLTWYLNGSKIGGTEEKLAKYFADRGIVSFAAQLCADLITELIDKLIIVVIAYFIIKLIPKHLKAALDSAGIRQAELSKELKKEVRNAKCRSVSLRTKVVLILSAASLLIAGTSTVISFMLYKQSTLDEHIKLANGLAEAAAGSIEADKVEGFVEKGEEAEGYIATEDILYRLRDSSPDVEYVYVYKIEKDGCHVVFDLDTEDLEGSEPGEVIPFDESFEEYIPTLLKGGEIDPIISDDSYGWLLTVYKPVIDSSGKCVCYAAVDISMNLLRTFGYSFIAKLVSLLISFFILTLTFGLWLVERHVTLPVNSIAYSAGQFAYNSDEEREKSVERIKQLDIRTGDEIENLYRAIVESTEESMRFVADIQSKTETISKMQNGLIMVLADMVENRDKCTGDHVRKTAAYCGIILKKMKELGFYKEQMTDQFMDDMINAAPLHDVGKIHISDIILNKPGRLTDEEFEIMKTHTVLGSKIIDKAIAMVADSSYLNEAKNVSEYHHEKWNGKGYPHGLSGEEIPLSARIMAVADVFDALVSERSYKKPFTFEKAMSIIKEDAGSHFDPLVAEAFLAAEDEVRKVAQSFDNRSETIEKI
ncbi:MAG: HD domain-containing protein [Ruminococcus sp.]|nr:HD domain-containing protein [Ruminococcus sp.]